MVQLCLTFLALGTGHVIPAQGNGCIFHVFDEICARNTKLQIGTILTKSKLRVISAFAINKTDSKPSAISIIFHADLFCYFAKMLKDQQTTSQKEKESVTFTEGGGGGEGWYSTNVYTGEVRSRGPTPFLFTYHFRRKRHLFLIPSIDKWYPFHIPALKNQNVFSTFSQTKFIC